LYNANNENNGRSINSVKVAAPVEYDTDLRPYLEQVRREHPRLKPATIYGEACELWTETHLSCRQCGTKDWTKMPRNHPGYDLDCNNCHTKYQVKSGKKPHIKTKKNRCQIEGATYAAVSKCHAEYNVDYYLFDRSDTHIKNIYYVRYQNICCEKDIRKRKVTKKENIRAGRNGRNYCRFDLGVDMCEKIFPYVTVKP